MDELINNAETFLFRFFKAQFFMCPQFYSRQFFSNLREIAKNRGKSIWNNNINIKLYIG